MFRKDFHVKSNTAIRGSDRRKLRNNVTEQFPTLPADEVIPNKDDMTVMKIFTHADYTVLVYCLHGDPIFFEWEKQLYPTVYILWKYPHMLPSMMTWPPVLDKMLNGADLMLPGVIVPRDGLPEVTKGQLCAICLPGNAAPVAVGLTTMSGSDMIASGMKGKGLQTLHCYKDHLWKQGGKAHPPIIEIPLTVESNSPAENNVSSPPDTNLTSANGVIDNKQQELNSAPSEQPDTATEAGNNTADLPIEGATAGLADGTEHVEESDVVDIGATGDNDVADNEEFEDDIPPADKMDRLLYQCLLHSLKSKVKKSDLPLLTSTFYKNHMLPCCPKNQTMDIKKSSYKKLSKFLQAMQREQLLSIKATGKGVDSIVDIDRSHPDVRAFVIPDDVQDADDESPPDGATAGDDVVWSPPEIKEFYQVTSKMLPVLQSAGYSKGKWLAADEVRKAVTDYVKQNELADKTDRRLVVLDPVLHDAVMGKSEDSRTHLKWDELFTRSFQELTGGHQLVLGNHGEGDAASQTVKKGRIQPVELKIQRKAGNKLVTLITKLETFGVDPKDFSHRVQKGVSASSSVSALPGQRSGGQQPQQVLVQGNQIHYIERLLTEHYKIPRKYIHGLDHAPKSGRKR